MKETLHCVMTKMQILISIVIIKWQKLSTGLRSIHEILVVMTILILRHIGLLEADEDKIRKIRPKGTQVRILYVPREAIRP